MLLYRVPIGPVVVEEDRHYAIERDWDELINDSSLYDTLREIIDSSEPDNTLAAEVADPLAPISLQEIWACGVTYMRSRTARMEEAQDAAGGDFYDRVYGAERPEVFFKAAANRTVGTGQAMHLRKDSQWIVPEPELTLVVTREAKIVGYTVGNDLSCRDLEGENPLYLPQAKTFDRCAAVGPAILVSPTQPSPDTEIRLAIRRGDEAVFEGSTVLSQMKRSLDELVDFLFRDNAHAHGCLVMTGTGIVPPDDFCLQTGDVVEITIDGIGTLSNPME